VRRAPRERPYTAPFMPTVIAVLLLSLIMCGACLLALALIVALMRAHPGIVAAGIIGLGALGFAMIGARR
jgi:hypothetical protein